MFGSLVQRLQTLSPLTSPVTSPVSSPKPARRRYSKSPAARRGLKEEYREIQSDPEDMGVSVLSGGQDSKKCRAKRKAEKLYGKKSLDISAPLQGSKSMGRLDGLKQVQRLAQYEQYFQSLLQETAAEHPDHEPIERNHHRAKQAVKRGQEESDLERIQDLFPNDYLKLYDKDVITMKMKGLMRKRTSTAARLQRALSAKSLRPETPPSPPRPNVPPEKRTFIMEAPVQFATGVQSQERHLFLFTDMLLVAKARAGGHFKLKEKVRVSELWLSHSGLDEVTELNKSPDTSFVLGWPTTNVIATFMTQAARDLWWNTLHDVLGKEKKNEPTTTNIQVTYYDHATTTEFCKTFSVGPEQTASECVTLALEHFRLNAGGGGWGLWAVTARDEAPYPLVGHERLHAIKLSCLREGLSSEEGFDLDHCNNVHDPLARCHFILRSMAKQCDSEVKKSIKKSTTRMRLGHVFRRSLSKDSPGCLFGLPLAKISEGDNLPKPVMSMLSQLFAKGPFTQGIFRKSANARLVRELRDKLDSGENVAWEHVPVLVTSAVFKDFLRSLPDPLLCGVLYPEWRDAVDTPNQHLKLLKIKSILSQLPKYNHTLLCHFLCVLHHVARRASHTLMSAGNLGVCVGPSLLWGQTDSVTSNTDLRAVPALVETLVSHCQVLLGSHIPQMLGDPRDSGTEESDSLRRDDSSIDSLECSPPPRKDKMSLSRDSGLTMSDSQLYTADEEESGSTSSSGYDPSPAPPHQLHTNHAKITTSMSVPAEYVRVYGGWEERLNPNFQRQAWFRQRSRRLSSITTSTKMEEAVRRSASEESLLDTPPPPTPPRRSKPQGLMSEVNHSPRKVEDPNHCNEMNGNCNGESHYKTDSPIKSSSRDQLIYSDDKFGRHPPLRKVTAVHCEVVADMSPRSPFKDVSHTSIYGVNGVKKLSLSSAELNFSPMKSPEQNFTPPRSSDQERMQRVQETYSPLKSSDQIFSRSLDQSYSSSNIYNYSQRSADSSTISDQSVYSSPKVEEKVVLGFGAGDYYYATKDSGDAHCNGSECDDSSTLSDDDCTPHVSRSNSRGNEVTTRLRHLPPVHVDSTCFVRGRLKRKEERAAHRSRSLPPPPPYRPPPPANPAPTLTPSTQNRRAPITSYYLGDCSQSQRYVVTRTFMDEESYV